MFVRACCLTSSMLLLASGCQTPNTALFPWKSDSDKPALTEAELNRSLDGPAVNDEAFAAAAMPEETSDSDARDQRVAQWLSRGQEAIRQTTDSPHRSELLREATNSFREVLRLDEDNVGAFHGLAIVSDLTEDWQMAEMNYKRALSVSRDDPSLLNDLGYSYLLQKRFDEASRYLNRATQIDPRHEKAHINLAILEVQKGNHQSALAQLIRVYGDGGARAALAGIVREHGVSVSDDNMSTLVHQQPAGPPPFPESNRPEMDQLLGTNHQRTPAARPQPQMSVPQQWNGNASVKQQGPLFEQNGLIRAPAPQPPVRPVAATSDQISQQVAVQATQQSAVSVPQPAGTGRPVGHVVQLPAQTTVIRPQLPASANVYNPVARPAPPAGQVPAQPISQSQVSPARNGFNNRPLPPPPREYQPSVSAVSQQMQGANPASGGGYDPSQPPINTFPQQPGQFSSSGSYYGQPGQQTGQPQMYSSGQVGQASDMNPPLGMQAKPSANMPGAMSSHPVQQGYPQPHGTPMNTTGYQQPGNGAQPQGAYNGQQPVITNGGQQSFVPQYFAPPPVSVPGFHDPVRTAPDRLAEYRAERQQHENAYQQALHDVARPIGGNSLQ